MDTNFIFLYINLIYSSFILWASSIKILNFVHENKVILTEIQNIPSQKGRETKWVPSPKQGHILEKYKTSHPKKGGRLREFPHQINIATMQAI
jgi:hypothetical protein